MPWEKTVLSQTPSGQVVVAGRGREESADLRSMRMWGFSHRVCFALANGQVFADSRYTPATEWDTDPKTRPGLYDCPYTGPRKYGVRFVLMRRLIHATRFVVMFLLCFMFFASASTALGSTIFSNTTGISIPATSGSLPVTSNPYPSQIAVSGMVGTLTDVSVMINGWTDNGTSANPGDLYFLLVGPGGEALDFMGDVGSNHSITNINLNLTDSASSSLTSGQITTGSFKPTVLGSSCPAFPTPAPSSVDCAAPEGTTTFFSLFEGSDPDGTWSLYILDDTAGDTASSISRGWSLAIDSTGGFVPPPPSVPEPSGLELMGLAVGVFAFCRKIRHFSTHPSRR